MKEKIEGTKSHVKMCWSTGTTSPTRIPSSPLGWPKAKTAAYQVRSCEPLRPSAFCRASCKETLHQGYLLTIQLAKASPSRRPTLRRSAIPNGTGFQLHIRSQGSKSTFSRCIVPNNRASHGNDAIRTLRFHLLSGTAVQCWPAGTARRALLRSRIGMSSALVFSSVRM